MPRNIPDSAILTMHEHDWKITKQTSLLFHTNHTYYECKCGETKETYSNPGGEWEAEEFFKSAKNKLN
jgi:hypothetical protein